MRINFVSDDHLIKAIQSATVHFFRPDLLVKKYGLDASLAPEAQRMAAKELGILLELQERRRIHPPLESDGIELKIESGRPESNRPK